MATFDFSASNASTSTQWSTFGYLGLIADAQSDFSSHTSKGFTATWAGLTFKGWGTSLQYDADHHPKAGTVTSFEVIASGKTIIKLSGLNAPVTDIKAGFAGGFEPFNDFLKELLKEADTFKGSQANDYFEGFAGNDKIFGNKGDDHLVGDSGADTLDGGLGADSLNGGSGNDHFRFTTALGNTNKDVIFGYSAAADTIELSNAIFVGTGANGTKLAASQFKVLGYGNSLDASDRIIYVQSTGDLYFDPDGSGAQGAIKFAQLQGSPTLTHDDFLII